MFCRFLALSAKTKNNQAELGYFGNDAIYFSRIN